MGNGPAYVITDSVDPRIIGELVTLEHVTGTGEVRLDPDFIGEHWYFEAGEVMVTPAPWAT